MCNKLITWIKNLLSDSKNLPSTRLHLAWGCFFLLCYAVYVDKAEYIVNAVALAMAGMSGISVWDKGGKNDKGSKSE